MMKAENDRLVTDIEKLKQRLREEITRTQAGVRLDLNLEKGATSFDDTCIWWLIRLFRTDARRIIGTGTEDQRSRHQN